MRSLVALAVCAGCERSGLPPEKPPDVVRYGDPAWRMLGTVDHVAVSRDEATVYVVAQDGALAAFDARTGARTTISDQLVPDMVQSVARIDDRSLAVIGDTPLVIDLIAKQTRPLRLPPKTRELAIAGARAVTTNRRGLLQVVDLASGNVLRDLDRSRGYWEPEIVGERVIAGRSRDTLGIWNLETGAREAVFALGNSNVFGLAPDQRHLATGTFYDRAAGGWLVELYELAGREVARFAFGACNPQRVAFSPTGKQLAIGCDNEIRIVEVPSGTVVQKLPGPRAYLRVLAWSPRGSLLVAGGNDSVVHVWDTSRWQPRTRVVGPRGEIGRLAASERTVLTLSFAAASAWSWDAASGRPLTSFGHEAHGLAFDGPDILISLDGTPDRIERRSRAGAPIARRDLADDGIAREVGPVLGRGAWQLRDGIITVFDARLAPLWSTERRDELVNANAVASPDGRRIALYGTGTFQLVDAIDRRVVTTRPTPTCLGEELAVSPDALRVAGIDETGIRILDATTAAPLASLAIPTERYDSSRAITFADRDRVLALARPRLVAWTIGTRTATAVPLPHVVRVATHGDHIYLALRDGTARREPLAKLLATGVPYAVAPVTACPEYDEGFGHGGLISGGEAVRGKLDNRAEHQDSDLER